MHGPRAGSRDKTVVQGLLEPGGQKLKAASIGRLLAFVVIVSIAWGTFAFANAGGEETGKLEHQVTLEGKSGANLLLARWYNENRLLFALAVTATMAVLGIVVGQVTEFALRVMGVR
jgi:hypothetical protein